MDEATEVTEPKPLREVLREVCPANAHHYDGGPFSFGTFSSTWTTPEGTWTVSAEVMPLVSYSLVIQGPGGEWRITGEPEVRTRRVVALLRALDAIPPEASG